MFVTKSGVVDQAVKAGVLGGGWVAGDGAHGGYFQLAPAVHDEAEFSSTETLVGEEVTVVAEKAQHKEVEAMHMGLEAVTKHVERAHIEEMARHLGTEDSTGALRGEQMMPQIKGWAIVLTRCRNWVRERRRIA
jgi:hypothetical protein